MTPDYGPLNEWINRRANGTKPTVRVFDGCWHIVGSGVRGTSFNQDVAWTLWKQAVRHKEDREAKRQTEVAREMARREMAAKLESMEEKKRMDEKARIAKAKQVVAPKPDMATRPELDRLVADLASVLGKGRDAMKIGFAEAKQDSNSLKAELIHMKADLIKWIVGISLGFFAAGLTAMGLFVQFGMAK